MIWWVGNQKQFLLSENAMGTRDNQSVLGWEWRGQGNYHAWHITHGVNTKHIWRWRANSCHPFSQQWGSRLSRNTWHGPCSWQRLLRMAEEQKAASAQGQPGFGTRSHRPIRKHCLQPANEGRSWQPALPVEPSSSPIIWGLQKAGTLLQPSCHFPRNKVLGHPDGWTGKAALYW